MWCWDWHPGPLEVASALNCRALLQSPNVFLNIDLSAVVVMMIVGVVVGGRCVGEWLIERHICG